MDYYTNQASRPSLELHRIKQPARHTAGGRAPERLSLLRYLCFGALLLFGALAQAREFTIHDVQTHFDGNTISVDARIDLSLNEKVLDALHNGIPITVSTVIDMARIRRYIPDQDIADWQFDYHLSYHSLSDSYLLDTPFTDGVRVFHNLQNALALIGDFHFHSDVITETLPSSKRGYALSLRSFLNIDALPAPLRVIAVVHPAWRLNSKPYRWVAP